MNFHINDDEHTILHNVTNPQIARKMLEGLEPEKITDSLMSTDLFGSSVIESALQRNDNDLVNSLLLGASFFNKSNAYDDYPLQIVPEEVDDQIRQNPNIIYKKEQLLDLFRGDSDRSDALIGHFNNNVKDYVAVAKKAVADDNLWLNPLDFPNDAPAAQDVANRQELRSYTAAYDKVSGALKNADALSIRQVSKNFGGEKDLENIQPNQENDYLNLPQTIRKNISDFLSDDNKGVNFIESIINDRNNTSNIIDKVRQEQQNLNERGR